MGSWGLLLVFVFFSVLYFKNFQKSIVCYVQHDVLQYAWGYPLLSENMRQKGEDLYGRAQSANSPAAEKASSAGAQVYLLLLANSRAG